MEFLLCNVFDYKCLSVTPGLTEYIQIQLDLKNVHEWLQVKESAMSRAKLYTTLEEMELSLSTFSQISLDAQNKRLFFDPLKFSSVSVTLFRQIVDKLRNHNR